MTRSLHYEFLWRCEWILLSVINDMRFQGFLPSVMSIVSQEIEPDNALDYRNQLMNILNISEVPKGLEMGIGTMSRERKR
ncbi:putative cyclin [Helianthus annuus]|nr:putative cyclin [Helianthus annuus]